MKKIKPKNKIPGKPHFDEDLVNNEFRVHSWSAAEEYFKHKPSSVKRIFVREFCHEKLRNLLKDHAVRTDVTVLSAKDDLLDPQESLAIVVKITPIGESELYSELDQRLPKLLVLVDHITDPRNLGAIIRSCAFFGVRDIVIPSRRQVPITNAAVNTAQGGFALTNVSVVPNLTNVIKKLKTKGYWVIGTDMSGTPIRELVKKFEKVALVVGSEEKGISELVKKNCDVIATIPSSGETLESLNVSVALGICLYELGSSLN